jgi:hypothetical protein
MHAHEFYSEDHMLVRRVKTEHDWRGFPYALNPYLYCKRIRQDSEGQMLAWCNQERFEFISKK